MKALKQTFHRHAHRRLLVGNRRERTALALNHEPAVQPRDVRHGSRSLTTSCAPYGAGRQAMAVARYSTVAGPCCRISPIRPWLISRNCFLNMGASEACSFLARSGEAAMAARLQIVQNALDYLRPRPGRHRERYAEAGSRRGRRRSGAQPCRLAEGAAASIGPAEVSSLSS